MHDEGKVLAVSSSISSFWDVSRSTANRSRCQFLQAHNVIRCLFFIFIFYVFFFSLEHYLHFASLIFMDNDCFSKSGEGNGVFLKKFFSCGFYRLHPSMKADT